MKTTKMIASLLFTAVFGLVFLMSQGVQAQAKAKAWPVPAADKGVKASVKLTDASVIANGKDLWAKNCKSCHGAKGLGDGPKAATLKTLPGDFTTAEFQGATEGELYFRLNKGRDEMPAYEKKIPEASDRWALVAYIKTLKK